MSSCLKSPGLLKGVQTVLGPNMGTLLREQLCCRGCMQAGGARVRSPAAAFCQDAHASLSEILAARPLRISLVAETSKAEGTQDTEVKCCLLAGSTVGTAWVPGSRERGGQYIFPAILSRLVRGGLGGFQWRLVLCKRGKQEAWAQGLQDGWAVTIIWRSRLSPRPGPQLPVSGQRRAARAWCRRTATCPHGSWPFEAVPFEWVDFLLFVASV